MAIIPTRVVPSVAPSARTPRQVDQQLRRWIGAGARIEPAGAARSNPLGLLTRGYRPKHEIELFDTRYLLTNVRQNADIRFFVAYVVQDGGDGVPDIHPRIFYKDVSLVWRSASHYIRSGNENWIGKGELKTFVENGEEIEASDEATTDLPLEIQTALETLSRTPRRIQLDEAAVGLVLRRGPDDRIAPYRDFTEPRRKARADRRNWIHRGRKIARFTRKNDPTSLRFAHGFEPDFSSGILEISRSTSRLYGGPLKRFRILSQNRRVQYLFIAGRHQVWIGSCQATTTEIMSYGVRTIDVSTDEDLLLPGYEYCFIDDGVDPPVRYSQIPEGFAGETHPFDDSRADASPWLDRMPVIHEFRTAVLSRA